MDRITIESTDDDAVSTAVCVSPPRTPVREHRGEVIVLPPTLPSLRICPKKLVGYTIIEHVGGGSFGDVYKASMKHVDGVTLVAVKVMTKNLKSAKRSVEQGRELNTLKQLGGFHPNIIKLLAWRETHFNVQLVFPFVHQDLRKFIAHHAELVTIEAARVIGSQLFSALAFIHKRNIIHRDIKPENILVQVQGQPLAAQLSDFGAARTLLPHIMTGTSQHLTPDVCTLWYRAPEILLAHGTYSFPADVWSLGISIAQIELGHSPFRQSTEIGMMFDICKASGPPGKMGKLLFSSFKAAGGAWGNRYGMAFGL